MATGTIKIERLEEMKKSPLFFLRRHIHEYRDNKGHLYEEISWESTEKDITASFTDNNWDDETLNFSLAIIDRFDEPEKESDENVSQPENISFSFHAMQSNSAGDWLWIIQNTINRKTNPIDKFWMRELIWVLNWRYIDRNALHNALQSYEQAVILQFLGWVTKLSKCLSQNKQAFIATFLSGYGISYSVNLPTLLKEACNITGAASNPLIFIQTNEDYRNIFDWVDLLSATLDYYPIRNVGNHNNIWLDFLHWMNSDDAFCDYSRLKQIIAMVAEPIRMEIMKRYFHDIRIGNTTYDSSVIEQFRHNEYAQYIRYRACIQQPGNPIDLSVPILADNVLTFVKTEGKAFQTFDGLLDFVMQNSDVTNPNISFRLEKFMPVCHGGAIYNKANFTGFIDYSIICKIDESRFTEENLKETIEELLNRSRARKKFVCQSDNKYVYEETALRCIDFKCEQIQKYEHTWWIMSDYSSYVNLFLEDKLYQTQDNNVIPVEFADSQISTEILGLSVRNIIGKYEQLGDGKFIIPSNLTNTFETRLISQYSKPESMRIIPLKTALIGLEFDVFGIWSKLREQLTPEDLSRGTESSRYKQLREEYKKLESAEVFKRVVNSLTNELGVDIIDYSYFEIPYSRTKGQELKNRYYYRSSYLNEERPNEFLCKQYIKQYPPFCAPQLAANRNDIIDFPYFWCRGIECFHNNLSEQALETCSDWKKYSLYHMIEILGYPKLRKTEAGYEPDNCIREFIGVANKAIQKFKRLKCRDCGHLIFTDRNYSYNRYNYFSCQNPSCKQHLKLVYLNFCHQCKKGLIDSRDSVRCPNGWYICPTCLSCCNDQQYERQAQRYVIERRPIPPRIQSMLGKGHNDKGEFFCYQCGVLLEEVLVEKNKRIVCPNCNKDYTDALRQK